MQTIETSIEIDATPEAVWVTLVDFEAYPDWNPFITAATGSPEAGARLSIHIQPPEGRGMGFKPTVTAAVPSERLEWLGRLGVRGVFDGRHEFRLEPLADGRTRLVQRESFSGLLVGLLLDEADISAGFEAMNEALKNRVEATGTDAAHQTDTGVAA